MKLLSILIALLAASAAYGEPARVGVVDAPSIVVAYYRSPMWAEMLRSQTARLDEAKRVNDTRKVQELEAWGSAQQELAHKQLAGEVSIASLVPALQPLFADVARKARVAIIVADLPFSDGSLEKVDVTELLLGALQADERTRKAVRELRSRRKEQ